MPLASSTQRGRTECGHISRIAHRSLSVRSLKQKDFHTYSLSPTQYARTAPHSLIYNMKVTGLGIGSFAALALANPSDEIYEGKDVHAEVYGHSCLSSKYTEPHMHDMKTTSTISRYPMATGHQGKAEHHGEHGNATVSHNATYHASSTAPYNSTYTTTATIKYNATTPEAYSHSTGTGHAYKSEYHHHENATTTVHSHTTVAVYVHTTGTRHAYIAEYKHDNATTSTHGHTTPAVHDHPTRVEHEHGHHSELSTSTSVHSLATPMA